MSKLNKEDIRYIEFREPDIGYEITSIALLPNTKNKKLLSSIPLAGRDVEDDNIKREWLKKRFYIVEQMESCFQAENQNMLEHGLSVYNKFLLLKNYIEKDIETEDLYIPNWLKNNKEYFKLAIKDKLYTIEKYIIWHDIGKFACKTIDEDGRTHYPNHTEESYKLAKEYLPEIGSEAHSLIRLDMELHTAKVDRIPFLVNLENLSILLLSALASIHSNAEMFGGFNSTSFKIKYKNLTKLGDRIFEALHLSIPKR